MSLENVCMFMYLLYSATVARLLAIKFVNFFPIVLLGHQGYKGLYMDRKGQLLFESMCL